MLLYKEKGSGEIYEINLNLNKKQENHFNVQTLKLLYPHVLKSAIALMMTITSTHNTNFKSFLLFMRIGFAQDDFDSLTEIPGDGMVCSI